uniref:Uncharacterized protein n=1 Tax=Panagrolaimus sp. JU765 TaxID=591449 RepID=A0AC34RBS1_9BILA
MESQVSVPQYETPPDVSVLEQPQEEDNKQRADSIKPIPAARSTSTTTSNNQSDTLLSMEKRLEECERKLAALSSRPEKNSGAATSLNFDRPETTSGVGTSLNFDRYEFAMDVYVKVAASETIPAAVKTEIKKLLLSAAIES